MSESEPFIPPHGHSSQATCLIVGLIGVAVVAAMIVLLAIVGFAVLFVMRATVSHDASMAAIGSKLPAVNLQPLTGDAPPVVAEDLEGRVVLINVWATWCPPCKQEFPHIVALYEEFRNRDDFMLLSLPISKDDLDELRIDTENFLQQQGARIPTYVDPTGATIEGIVAVTGDSSIPRTLVLDRTGTIRDVWVGYSPGLEQQMKRRIEQLLDE